MSQRRIQSVSLQNLVWLGYASDRHCFLGTRSLEVGHPKVTSPPGTGELQLWKTGLDTGFMCCITAASGSQASINTLCYTAERRTVASGEGSGQVVLWDINSGIDGANADSARASFTQVLDSVTSLSSHTKLKLADSTSMFPHFVERRTVTSKLAVRLQTSQQVSQKMRKAT